MNRNLYRVIFSKALGVMVVASELPSAQGKSGSASRRRPRRADRILARLTPLSFATLVSLGGVLIGLPMAQAAIVADPQAPNNQQPTILNTANGLPLVNIQTPSAAGVSRNTYSQFDVARQGAILNNARTNTATQLGGWVQGNPWLAAGSARVILNEVNSANPSQLKGYVEVAGQRAEVVIANPAGISIDGGGFLNASRATLTTGTPILNGGNLEGYRVQGGTISVTGAGLDASRTDYTDLIARAVDVNAGIWAHQLEVTTGANHVDTTNNTVAPIAGTGAVPTVSIDVAQLGGMYAGKITLVGTEAGVGVRNAGNIGATAGELVLTANGQLENAGQMSSATAVHLDANGNIRNTGTIYSGGDADLGTRGDIANHGVIAAQGNTHLVADGSQSQVTGAQGSVLGAGIQADGSLGSGGDLSVTATRAIADHGKHLSGGDQRLQSGRIDRSDGQSKGANLQLDAGGDIDLSGATLVAEHGLSAHTGQTLRTDGAHISGDQLDLQAHDLSNVQGDLVQIGSGDLTLDLPGDVDNSGGRIAGNSRNLSISAAKIDNTGGRLQHAGDGTLSLTASTYDGRDGQVIGNGRLELEAGSVTLDGGSTVARQLTIDSGSLSNRNGTVIQTGSGTGSITTQAGLDNTDGSISSNGGMTLSAGELDNRGGSIQAAGGDLTVHAADGVDNSQSSASQQSGRIGASGAVQLTAETLDNSQGQITAEQGLTVDATGSLSNRQGLLAANGPVTLSAGQIDNSQGHIGSVQDRTDLTATAGAIDNSGGQITASRHLQLSGHGVTNVDGLMQGGSLGIDSPTLDNTRGQLATTGAADNGALTIQSSAVTNDQGLIQATGDLTLNSQGPLDNAGQITSTGHTRIDSTAGIQNSGTIYSGGDADLGTRGDIANHGVIAAQGNTHLVADGSQSQVTGAQGSVLGAGIQADGSLGSGGDLSVTATRAIADHGKHLSGGDQRLQSGRIDRSDGQSKGANLQLDAGGDIDLSGATLVAEHGLSAHTGQTLRTDGAHISGDQLDLQAHDLSNVQGDLVQIGSGDLTLDLPGDVDNSGGRIAGNSRNLSISAAKIDNTGGRLQHAGDGTLSLTASTYDGRDGQVIGNGRLELEAGSVTLDGGSTVARQLTIDSGSLSNRNGTVIQTGSGTGSITTQAGLDNTDGSISSNGGMTLSAGELDNRGGSIQAAGGDLTIHAADGVDNRSSTTRAASDTYQAGYNDYVESAMPFTAYAAGQISASGNISLTSRYLFNMQGRITANKALHIDTREDLHNARGLLAADQQVTVHAQRIDNIQGSIASVHGGTDVTISDTLENSAGVIEAAQGLHILGQEVMNTTGLMAGSSIDLNTQGSAFDNTFGKVIASGAQDNGALTIQSGYFANHDGIIQAQGAVGIDAAGEVENSGQITSRGDTRVDSQVGIRNSGTIYSAGHTTLGTQGSLDNRGGAIQAAGGDLTIHAADGVDNSQSTATQQGGRMGASGAVHLTAETLANSQGQITAEQGLTVDTTDRLTNSHGLLAANGPVSLTAGQIDNSQGHIGSVQDRTDLIATAGGIDNSGGQIAAALHLQLSGHGVMNAGGLINGSSLKIDGHNLDNTRGQLVATGAADSGALTIQSGAVVNDRGLIQAQGSLHLDTQGQTLTNTHSAAGQGIIGLGDVQLNTGAMDNAGGFVGSLGDLSIVSAAIGNVQGGVLTSSGQMNLTGRSLDNRGGQIQALGNVTMTLSDALDNTASLVRSGQTLNVSAAGITNVGTQGSNQGLEGGSVHLTAPSIDNASGAIRADRDIVLTSGGDIQNVQGLISGQQTVQVQDVDPANAALQVTNTAGTMIAGQRLSIDSAGLTGDGKLLSRGDLSLNLRQGFTLTGELTADGHATVTTAGTLRNQAVLNAGQDLAIQARRVENTDTGEITAQNTSVTASDAVINRGLIDGQATGVSAATVDNLGTGRMYGDHLSIAATRLVNAAENGVAGVIAARNRLDIGAGSVQNLDHALMFSLGDMAIGGGLDARQQATGTADSVVNRGATINALGALTIDTRDLQNLNANLVTQQVDDPAIHEAFVVPDRSPVQYNAANCWGIGGGQDKNSCVGYPGQFEDYTLIRLTTVASHTEVVSTQPGQILSGGDLTLSGGDVLNQDSHMVAGGVMTFTGANFLNQATQGQDILRYSGTAQHTHVGWGGSFFSKHHERKWDGETAYMPPPVYGTPYDLPTTLLEQNTAVSGTGASIAARSSGSVAQTADGAGSARVAVSPAAATGTAGQGPAVGGNPSGIVPAVVQNGWYQGIPLQHPVGSAQSDTPAAAVPTDTVQGPDLAANAPTANGPSALPVAAVTGAQTDSLAQATRSGTVNDGLAAPGDHGTPVANPAVSVAPLSGNTARGPAGIVRTGAVNTTIPRNSLFHVTPDPSAGYLIATDSRFTDYRQWISSDYLLNQLKLDPATTQKRLGDGFYEQRLVQEQVAQLTGRRFLEGYASDQSEYMALMNAGLTYARQWHLVPGVALTAAQMAQLTSDMVWLVERSIILPDGSTQKVLVPQVYTVVHPGDVNGAGSLVSAQAIDMQASGSVQNSGTLAGRSIVSLAAENVKNLGGRITGGHTVALNARQDIENLGGTITAGDLLAMQAGRDITIATTTRSGENPSGASRFSRTGIDQVARVGVENPDGVLQIAAGRDINLTAAQITNAGTGQTILQAKRDLTLSAITTGEQNNVVWNADNHLFRGNSQDIGTTIKTQGAVQLTAGQDIQAKAAQIASTAGAVDLQAGRNISLINGQTSRNWDQAIKVTSRGFLSRSTSITRDSTADTQAIGTVLSGDSVHVMAGNDVTLQGSRVAARNDIALMGGGDVSLLASQDTHTESHYAQSSKSGLTTSGYGSSSKRETHDLDTIRNTGSDLHSQQGNIALIAGALDPQDPAQGIALIQGSRVQADAGRVDIGGRHIILSTSADTSASASTLQESKSTWAFTTGLPGGHKRGVDADRQQVTLNGSTVNGREGVSLQANGIVDIAAGQLNADRGDIQISGAQVSIHSDLNSSSASSKETYKKTGVNLRDLTGTFTPGKGIGYKTALNTDQAQTTRAPASLTGQNIAIQSTAGDITLNAIDATAKGTTTETGDHQLGTLSLDAAHNLNLASVTTTASQSSDQKHKDLAWQGVEGHGTVDQTTQYNHFNAEQLKLSAANRITADMGVRDSAAVLAQEPGMGWLKQLQQDSALNQKVDWKRIEEAHQKWDYKQQGLTPAAAAVVAVVVAYFTAGAGTAAVGTSATAGGVTTTSLAGTTLATTTAAGVTTYSTAGVILNTAVTTLASQASVSLINNQGNVGKTLHELGSSANLRQLATAVVTAGVLNGIGGIQFGEGKNAFRLNDVTVKDGLTANIGKNLVNGLARATLTSAITGTDLQTNLQTELVSGVLNAAAAQGANWIGDVAMKDRLNVYAHSFAHAVAGCLAGAAGASATGSGIGGGKACGAGAIGAAVGELSAQLYNSGNGDAPAKQDTVAFASMMGGIAAALTGQNAQGVAIASGTAANAAQNNWLNHADAARLKLLKEKRLSGQCDARCDSEIAGLELVDKLNNRLLLNACVNGTEAECTAQLNRDPAAKSYGYQHFSLIAWGRVLSRFGDSADQALGSLVKALDKAQIKALVDAQGTITGWAVDLGGSEQDSLRHWLGAGVYVGSTIILPTSAIDLIPGAGKGLKVVTQGAERVVVEEATGKVLGKVSELPPSLGGVANKPEGLRDGPVNATQGANLKAELSELSRYQPDTRFDDIYRSRTDQSILKDNNFDMDHVLSGEINGRKAATGYHAELAADGASRIAPGAEIKFNANGTYEAPVQVFDANKVNPATGQKGMWVNKFADSTFFPPSWSQARIEYEVSEAFKNKRVNPEGGWVGQTPSGVDIQIYWDARNRRTTFYPYGSPKK
ncbi:hypothetical protein A9404_07895 [Halothiobacillus diazotrophicus]|uniref:Filamentous haemagglutinin FhaB/tRNA nuclease CdiA-like TPS domain-containing protein n=1 Tax=Halothiobacillus diazotrophicus TaxID=1860122 RepID=A0A191ZHE7_9GAMM|nr:filamentous hemagglutinin N-terminal domain-containing protein [Halothiobacillus diazotrophicus]ANJ67316.1 hypothetical protein A9404_07895 [Halothiobacillus diazotrophicus]